MKIPAKLTGWSIAVIFAAGVLLPALQSYAASRDVGIYRSTPGDKISGYRIIAMKYQMERKADGSVAFSEGQMIEKSGLYRVRLKEADEMVLQCDYYLKNAQLDRDIQFGIEFTLWKREGSSWKQLQSQYHKTAIEPLRTLNGILHSNSFKVKENGEYKVHAKCAIDGKTAYEGTSFMTFEPELEK